MAVEASYSSVVAMSMEHEMVEGSTVLDHVGALLNRDGVLSIEDQAWVDSFFFGESETIDSNLDSFQNVLQEFDTLSLVQPPVSKVNLASESDYSASPNVRMTDSSPVLCSEDQAWADSCFVEGSEISDINWDAFKNALEDVGTSNGVHLPVSKVNPASGLDYSDSLIVGTTDNNASSDDGEENEEGSDGDMMLDSTANKSKLKKVNGIYPFRPSYSENLQENENPDLGLDLDLDLDSIFDFSGDVLPRDIFKIWDLAIPAEEEDGPTTKQSTLQSSFEKLPSTSDDFEACKVLRNGSLDDLIAGISDLSLDLASK